MKKFWRLCLFIVSLSSLCWSMMWWRVSFSFLHFWQSFKLNFIMLIKLRVFQFMCFNFSMIAKFGWESGCWGSYSDLLSFLYSFYYIWGWFWRCLFHLYLAIFNLYFASSKISFLQIISSKMSFGAFSILRNVLNEVFIIENQLSWSVFLLSRKLRVNKP